MMIVLTTVSTESEARALAIDIVESRLAACVQVMPQIWSVYVWKGDTTSDSEYLLLIKTIEENWAELYDFVTERHPYEVPEIAAIDTARVSPSYREWLHASVRAATRPSP